MHKRGLRCGAVAGSLMFVYSAETAKDTAIVATECESETVLGLLNGTIFTDLE